MANDEEWEIADTIGDRAQDWDEVTDTHYSNRRGPDDPAQTMIDRAGRRYIVTVRALTKPVVGR